MTSAVFQQGRVAVITGAAMGIGLAAAKRFAAAGMRICMADIDGDELERAAEQVAGIAPEGDDAVLAAEINVARLQEVQALSDAAFDRFGEVGLLMNNAATRVAGGTSEELDDWHRTMDVNFWGVVHGVRAFLPRMSGQDAPSAIVNTGSKQGITNPPGNVIYNVTKSAVKTYTEQLQHELRNTEGWQGHRPSAGARLHHHRQAGAQARGLAAGAGGRAHGGGGQSRGDFYIICPDNEVTSEMDRKRILWGAGDITENRPPLSRWHPDFGEAFDKSSADCRALEKSAGGHPRPPITVGLIKMYFKYCFYVREIIGILEYIFKARVDRNGWRKQPAGADRGCRPPLVHDGPAGLDTAWMAG